MPNKFKDLAFEYLINLRDREYLQYFNELATLKPMYFSELMNVIIDQAEQMNTFYSRLPSYFKDLIRLSVIYYDTTTKQNERDYFPFIKEYESILGIDNSYRRSNNLIHDLFGSKSSSIMIIGYSELLWMVIAERTRLENNLQIKDQEEQKEIQTRRSCLMCCASASETVDEEEKEPEVTTGSIKQAIDDYKAKEAIYRIRLNQIYKSMNSNPSRFITQSFDGPDQILLLRYLASDYRNPFRDLRYLYYPRCRVLLTPVDLKVAIDIMNNALRIDELNFGFLHYATIAWYNTRISRSATYYRNAIRMYYFAVCHERIIKIDKSDDSDDEDFNK